MGSDIFYLAWLLNSNIYCIDYCNTTHCWVQTVSVICQKVKATLWVNVNVYAPYIIVVSPQNPFWHFLIVCANMINIPGRKLKRLNQESLW